MTKEKLKTFLELLEAEPHSEWISIEYTAKLHKCITLLLKEIFTKEQYEWIEWWIWENNFGKEKLSGSYPDKDGTIVQIVDYDTFYGVLNIN